MIAFCQNTVTYKNYFVMSGSEKIQENRYTELKVEYSTDGYSGIDVTYPDGKRLSFEITEILNSNISNGSTTARYMENINHITYIITTYNKQGICMRKVSSAINACYNN